MKLLCLLLSALLWVGALPVAEAATMVKDCPNCPDLVQIPAGSYQSRGDSPHRVTFNKPFFMSATLITQGQWRALMGHNPSTFNSCGDACPVENVSWEEAQVFILRLNVKTGKHYALPSETQWEYACIGRTSQNYCGSSNVTSIAWFQENSDNTTHPVATKRPNEWGLFDMNGNVWEWLEDCYHDSLKGAPNNGKAWEDAMVPEQSKACPSRVLRGGAWNNSAEELMVGRRSADDPHTRSNNIGFRVVRID
ncbi:MAG: formylglycine-generating enzyme family protein [Betaproteobacteria bacterium]|nr:formylglycine-generating enzyme family protein [Betaproteobacteria bacterium]